VAGRALDDARLASPAFTIEKMLAPIMTQAPLIDEDAHFVLFHQPGAAPSPADTAPPAAGAAAAAALGSTVTCTVYMPLPVNVGSHGRDNWVPFTSESVDVRTGDDCQAIVWSLVDTHMTPERGWAGSRRAFDFGLFLHLAALGSHPVELAPTSRIADVAALVDVCAHGRQPRLELVPKASLRAKHELLGMIVAEEGSRGRAAFHTRMQAVAELARADAAADPRTRLAAVSVVASHNPRGWQERQVKQISSISLRSVVSVEGVNEDDVVFSGWCERARRPVPALLRPTQCEENNNNYDIVR
jgi:hypothetical protein